MNFTKAVLFDLDGVLVDACDWHYEALNKALRSVTGYEISREDHESTYNGLPTRVKLSKLADKGLILETQIDKVCNLKQYNTQEILYKKCEFDRSKVDLMKHLKGEGYMLGCVTNSIEKTAKFMLNRVGIQRYMDCIVSNQDVKNPKPHPEGYIKAMVMLNSLPENTTIVEDSPKGIQAANATGARVIVVENATQVMKEMI